MARFKGFRLAVSIALLVLAFGESHATMCEDEYNSNWDPLECSNVEVEDFAFRAKSAQAGYKSCMCTSCGGQIVQLKKKNSKGALLGCEFSSEREEPTSYRSRFLGINPFEKLVNGALNMLGARPEYAEEAAEVAEKNKDRPFVEVSDNDGVVARRDSTKEEFAAAAESAKDPTDERTVAIPGGGSVVTTRMDETMLQKAWENRFPTLWNHYTKLEHNPPDTEKNVILEDGIISSEDFAEEAYDLLYTMGYSGDSPHEAMEKLSIYSASEIFSRKGPLPLAVEDATRPSMVDQHHDDTEVGGPIDTEEGDGTGDNPFDNDLNTNDAQVADARELHTIWILNAKAYTDPRAHVPKKHRVRQEGEEGYEKDATFAPGMQMKPEFHPNPLELVKDHSANTFGFAEEMLAFVRAHVWRDVVTGVVYVTFRGSENLMGPLSHLLFNIISQSFKSSFKDMASVMTAAIVGLENGFHRVVYHSNMVDCPATLKDFSCHEGAVQYWDLLRDHIRKDLHQISSKYGRIPRVIFNGYSMGGMLAQLAAVDMASHRPSRGIPVDTITIGSPRVGDWFFDKHAESTVSRMIRFALQNDPIPSFPWSTSYGNMGPMVVLTRKGALSMVVGPEGNSDGIQGYGMAKLPSYLKGGVNFLYSHTPWFIGPAVKKFAKGMVAGDDETLKPLKKYAYAENIENCPECEPGQFKIKRPSGIISTPQHLSRPHIDTSFIRDNSGNDEEFFTPRSYNPTEDSGSPSEEREEEFSTPRSTFESQESNKRNLRGNEEEFFDAFDTWDKLME